LRSTTEPLLTICLELPPRGSLSLLYIPLGPLGSFSPFTAPTCGRIHCVLPQACWSHRWNAPGIDSATDEAHDEPRI